MSRFGSMLLALLLLCAPAAPAAAQEAQTFALVDARAGESYEQNIPDLLNEQYGMRVSLGSPGARARWEHVGTLPAGLELAEDGTLTGTPAAHRAQPYRFRVRVFNAQAEDAEALTLRLTLKVLPPKVRLVPVGAEGNGAAQNSGRRGRPRNNGASRNAGSRDDAGDDDDGGENAEDGDGDEEEKPPRTGCGKSGITIETATAVRSELIPVTISVKDNSKVRFLEVTVRGPENFRHRLAPAEAAASPFTPDVPLTPGKNIISVEGLDADSQFVACAEKAVTYTASTVTGGPRVTLGRDFTLQEQPTFPLSVKLTGPRERVDQLEVVVRDEKNKDERSTHAVDPSVEMQSVVVNLRPGKNAVAVAGLGGDGERLTNTDRIEITCEGRCAAPAEPGHDDVLTVKPASFRVSNDAFTRVEVVIDNVPGLGSENKTKLVEQLYYTVTNKDQVVVYDGWVKVERKKSDEKTTTQPIDVGLAWSTREDTENTIAVVGYDSSAQPRRLTNAATTHVTCVNCTEPSSGQTGNSLYTRAIVGFEQVGGSAATSTQKPFMDFFFSAPIGKHIDPITPVFQFWGNARIASVTQQTNPGALGAFATGGFLTSFQNTDVNKLVQGFDFLAGAELRVIPRNEEPYFSLIPGVRQRTSLSLIASFGGITPLSVDDNTAVPRLFKIPTLADNTTLNPEFLALFPEAAGKKNVAFVAPARDRFFRQYYGGIRVRTLFYDKRRPQEPINRFPAIFDFTIGQNELVTGALRNVMRFEGFYPFPFRAASFFYIYGTATMKLGRRGGRTELPLFLQEATGDNATIFSPDTLLISVDKHPTLRSTRDNYRIGIGINLIELLNRLGTPNPQ